MNANKQSIQTRVTNNSKKPILSNVQVNSMFKINDVLFTNSLTKMRLDTNHARAGTLKKQ